MITLLDKQGKQIQEQDKIMARIEEYYSVSYDSDQAVTIQTDHEEVPPIMAWKVEAALRKMKNGKEAEKDQVNIETMKAGEETIAKQLVNHSVLGTTLQPQGKEAGQRDTAKNHGRLGGIAKHRDVFKSKLAIYLKRQLYNSCVLPAMTCGAGTWTLNKQAHSKLAVAHTKMERSMLNITYKDRKTNIWVRERTNVIEIINTDVSKMKWSWAGHINRLKDDQWTSRVITWRP